MTITALGKLGWMSRSTTLVSCRHHRIQGPLSSQDTGATVVTGCRGHWHHRIHGPLSASRGSAALLLLLGCRAMAELIKANIHLKHFPQLKL